MGCSSLNIDGVSKRVVYSESVNKMLQNPTFAMVDSTTYVNLPNFDGISKRIVYSESVKKMLQNGMEKSNFCDSRFGHLCKPTKL